MALETPMIPKVQSSGDKSLENTLQLKQLELNSLLEVTQAINSNLSEESLYKIFYFTLIANLKIKRFALYVLDEEWNCKVSFGIKQDLKNKTLPKKILQISTICSMDSSIKGFEEFDLAIPVAHKTNVLAYVLLGGNADQNEKTDIPFIQTFANIIIVAIENKKLARKELAQQALKKELEIARDVQSLLFPKSLPYTDNLKLKADYLPHHTIGGDYYDYIELDKNKFIICIADVSGKGIPAALLMSNFQASLRTLTRQTDDLKKIVNELNYIIKLNAKGDRFITFFIALIDTSKNKINFINAGHNPSFIISSEGRVEIMDKGTTVLGVFENLPFMEEGEIAYTKDSLLFLYTDGITETSNAKDDEFGQERLLKVLLKKKNEDLSKMHSDLLKDLNKFKGDKIFPDDITIFSCRIS
ncbi:MAG: PP2C family protein-serine/threonine phosphatase [Cytophagaceae bacterium]